jgi:ABC-type polysaccharide/polyol phosphate export permease
MQLAVLGIGESQLEKAVRDIWDGLRAWRLWCLFGLNDVKMRYRRSTLGPFWATLSMGIQILVTGFVMTYLFHTSIDRYLPFIAIGLITWGTMTGMVSESAMAFISSTDLILQVKRPLSVYLYQAIWRNMIVAAHSIVIFFVVAFLFGLFPRPVYILAIPGLALLFLNVMWMSGIAAILSTRFRDIPMIVANVFTALFWLTPIVYEPDQLGGRMQQLVMLNPLYHIVEVFRAPLLLSVPTATNWMVAFGTAVVGWSLLVLLFARTRTRSPYWL